MPKLKEGYKVIDPPMVSDFDDPRPIAYVCIDEIEVDQTVQRATTPERLDALARNGDGEDGINWALFEVITVTARANGALVATEGQHRDLLLRREYPRAHTWVVFSPDSNEAGVALAIAKSRKAHTPLEKWNARLRQGSRLEVRAEQVMANLQLRLWNSTTADSIAAVAAVERVMKMKGTDDDGIEAGARVLDLTLSTLVGAFQPSDGSRLEGTLILFLGRIFARNDNIRLPRVHTVLSSMKASRWVEKGADPLPKQTKFAAIGSAFIEAYNSQLGQQNKIHW